MRKPSVSTIIGEDYLVYVPTESSDMRLCSHHIIVFRPSPNIEFLEHVSGVKFQKTASIKSGEAYGRNCSWPEKNWYCPVTWNLHESEPARQFGFGHVPIDIGRHILCLSFACVLPLWDDVESRVVSFFDQDVSQRNVCSQLAIFRIGGGKPLIAGIPRGKSSGDCSGYDEEKCATSSQCLGLGLT